MTGPASAGTFFAEGMLESMTKTVAMAIDRAIADERAACARVADRFIEANRGSMVSSTAIAIASRIRERK